MSLIAITLPPSLTFLVSNFQSLVNLKLFGSNYWSWHTQVENVMVANGFFGYLSGVIECPPSKIQNAKGNVIDNPEFAL